MNDATTAASDSLLLWLLLLSTVTQALLLWRCHRAGVLAMFGHHATSGQALLRLSAAACLPALLCGVWFSLDPDLSAWAALGTAQLAIAWYGMRWLLPDGLATPESSPRT